MEEVKKKREVPMPGTMRNLNFDSKSDGISLPETKKEPQPQTQEVSQSASVESTKIMSFTELVDSYTGTKGQGQGQAIWVPNEVKKDLERIRLDAKKNVPLRALAAAMIKAFIAEHPDEIAKL